MLKYKHDILWLSVKGIFLLVIGMWCVALTEPDFREFLQLVWGVIQ